MKCAPLALLAVVALASLAACAPPRLVAPLRYAAAREEPNEPFRAQSPPLTPVTEATEPLREVTLPNGLRVVLAERHDFPVFAAVLVVDRGTLDVGDVGGVATAQMSYLFARGGDARVSEALSAEAAQTAARWSSDSRADSSYASVRAPSASFEASLSILTRLTFAARLTPEEHARRGAELKQNASRTEPLREAERSILFGRKHPYGFRHKLEEPISLFEAQSLHDRLFQPTHATLVVVGDVTPARLDASAERAFGAWRPSQEIARNASPPPALAGPRVVVASRHDLTQRFATVFARGPEVASADADAFALGARVLGGASSSTLADQLREGTGATYGVKASLNTFRTASWLSITASYDSTKAVEAARDVLLAIAGLRDGKISDAEIAVARETLLASWRGDMATVQGAASQYARWIADGLDATAMADYPARIQRLGRADLVRVAQTYLAPDALHVAFMGEDSWLDPAPLGMGPMTVLDLSK